MRSGRVDISQVRGGLPQALYKGKLQGALDKGLTYPGPLINKGLTHPGLKLDLGSSTTALEWHCSWHLETKM